MIFLTKAQRQFTRERIILTTSGDRTIRHPDFFKKKKEKEKPLHIPHTKINQQWIIDQNVEHRTIGVSEENVGETVQSWFW